MAQTLRVPVGTALLLHSDGPAGLGSPSASQTLLALLSACLKIMPMFPWCQQRVNLCQNDKDQLSSRSKTERKLQKSG